MDWKEKFLELYTSNDFQLYEKALEMKRKHIPEKLYRYRSMSVESKINRKMEIEHNLIYLSHPSELNDPLEASSLLQPDKIPSILKNEFKKRFSEIMPQETHYNIFKSDNWLNELKNYISQNSKIEETNQTLNLLMNKVFEELNRHINKLIRNNIRLLSFTTKPNNLPMWSHYSDNHKGICIEYNTADITNHILKESLFPVIYVDKLPDFIYMSSQKKLPEFSFFEYLAMHKLNDWSYEDEWRLILPTDFLYPDTYKNATNPSSNGKFIDFIKPSKIILGINIENSLESMLKEMAKNSNIKITKAKITCHGLEID